MTQKQSNSLKGYSCSFIGAVANSQYYFVLKVLVLSLSIVVTHDNESKFIFPFCLFITIEFFNLVYNGFTFGGTKFLKSIKTIFTYDGFFLFCCGIIGGPLGAACNLLCVVYAGPIIGILFSLLPALATTIFNRIFLKDRITLMAWISIFLTLVGVIGYSCFDLFNANSLSGMSFDKILIGLIFGLLNCIFWGLEVTILDFVYRKGSGKVKPISQPEALNIKFTSSVVIALLVIPLLDVSSKSTFDLGYFYLKTIFLDQTLIFHIAIASFVLYLVRFGLYFGTFYIKGIYTQFLILAGVILNPLFLYIYSFHDHDLLSQWNDFKQHWYKFFFILMAVSGIASFILLKDKNIKFAHNLKFFYNKK